MRSWDFTQILIRRSVGLSALALSAIVLRLPEAQAVEQVNLSIRSSFQVYTDQNQLITLQPANSGQHWQLDEAVEENGDKTVYLTQTDGLGNATASIPFYVAPEFALGYGVATADETGQDVALESTVQNIGGGASRYASTEACSIDYDGIYYSGVRSIETTSYSSSDIFSMTLKNISGVVLATMTWHNPSGYQVSREVGYCQALSAPIADVTVWRAWERDYDRYYRDQQRINRQLRRYDQISRRVAHRSDQLSRIQHQRQRVERDRDRLGRERDRLSRQHDNWKDRRPGTGQPNRNGPRNQGGQRPGRDQSGSNQPGRNQPGRGEQPNRPRTETPRNPRGENPRGPRNENRGPRSESPRTETPRTPRVETPNTPRTEQPRGPRGDQPRTREPRQPRTEQPGTTGGQQPNFPRGRDRDRGSRGEGRTPRTETPQTPRTESPRMPRGESPRMPRSESPRAPRSESPRTESPRAPRDGGSWGGGNRGGGRDHGGGGGGGNRGGNGGGRGGGRRG